MFLGAERPFFSSPARWKGATQPLRKTEKNIKKKEKENNYRENGNVGVESRGKPSERVHR